MVTKKQSGKKAPVEKAKPKKAAPKATKAKPQQVPEPEPVEEHVHSCGCGCEDENEVLDNNPARSYILRDVWFDSLCQVIDEESMPEENKREMLFLTLSNAMMDMIMDIVPIDMAEVIAENIDDFLLVTAVNQEYQVDLLQTFKQDFVDSHGDTFEDENELNNALADFEEAWWNAPRDDLRGKSPNAAMEELAEKYDL
ncbi:MAG TPA: hypothetical protein VLH13_04485 [Methanomassiliicoccales archaeon]|nr:hypothetical protein [Methanomassiliicoccales archaeon]